PLDGWGVESAAVVRGEGEESGVAVSVVVEHSDVGAAVAVEVPGDQAALAEAPVPGAAVPHLARGVEPSGVVGQEHPQLGFGVAVVVEGRDVRAVVTVKVAGREAGTSEVPTRLAAVPLHRRAVEPARA